MTEITRNQQGILDALANGGELFEAGIGEKSARLFPAGCCVRFEGRIVRAATIDALYDAGLIRRNSVGHRFHGRSYRLTTPWERARIAGRRVSRTGCS